MRPKRGKLGGEARRYCEYPSAVPHWERGLGFECKNSTINLFRAVAPHLCLAFLAAGKGWCLPVPPVPPLCPNYSFRVFSLVGKIMDCQIYT